MTTTEHREDNHLVQTSYYLEFHWRGENAGSGFSFRCDAEGNLDEDAHPAAQENYRSCLDGTHDVIADGIRKATSRHRLCGCGSGNWPERVYDARGIYLTEVCDACRKERLSRYRPEILTDSGYWHDEPISDEHWDY